MNAGDGQAGNGEQGGFAAALDDLLLDCASRYHFKPEYLPRHMGLCHASPLVNAALWLRDVPLDYLLGSLDALRRLAPPANLHRLMNRGCRRAARGRVEQHFVYLYDRLAGDDRELLLRVAAMHILGPRRVRIPGNRDIARRDAGRMRAVRRSARRLPGASKREILVDLRAFPELDLPIVCQMDRLMLNDLLLLRQYTHPVVHLNAGDIALDAGAFMGETALWMACRVGTEGRVFAFEFMPRNAASLEANLVRNPDLAPRIRLVRAALWSQSGAPVHSLRSGGSSRITFEPVPGGERVAETITIDDFTERERLDRLDFIKMDIEGAELDTLQGAARTLRTLKPKLAVALYHRTADFDSIPRFLDGLGAGYRFHLGHHTFGWGETILYATARGST